MPVSERTSYRVCATWAEALAKIDRRLTPILEKSGRTNG